MKLIMEKFNTFVKEEASKILLEEIDLKDHAKKVDFEKEVLPLLNQKLKQLKAIDVFELQIEITAATGDVETALEKIRKSLTSPEIAKKYPLEVQVAGLAKQMKTSKHEMTGAKQFVADYEKDYGNMQSAGPNNMDRVKAAARERAAAVQKAALGSEKSPGVSQGTIRNNRVVPGSVKGKAQNP